MTRKQIYALFIQADKLLGEAMRACKSGQARSCIHDAQLIIDDAIEHEERQRGIKFQSTTKQKG